MLSRSLSGDGIGERGESWFPAFTTPTACATPEGKGAIGEGNELTRDRPEGHDWLISDGSDW